MRVTVWIRSDGVPTPSTTGFTTGTTTEAVFHEMARESRRSRHRSDGLMGVVSLTPNYRAGFTYATDRG